MGGISPEIVAWALAVGGPLLLFAWNVQRMHGEVRKIQHVVDDLVLLLGDGDFARALSRLQDVGGSLGADVQEFLEKHLRRPSVLAGEAVAIADAHIVPRGVTLLSYAGLACLPFGLYTSCTSRRAWDAAAGVAVTLLGLASLGAAFALSFYETTCKQRIIRGLHEVQHAAEKWLKEHRDPATTT